MMLARAVAPFLIAWTLCGPASAAPLGTPCTTSATCDSTFCVDGVCCESSCEASCTGCSPIVGTIGREGECKPIAAGIDPKNDCLAEPPDTCRGRGVCDGDGQCALHADSTPCGLSGECTDGVCVSVPLCDGDHKILGAAGPIDDCAPFRCSSAGNTCLKQCTSTHECLIGLACSVDGRCEAPVAAESVGGGCGTGGHPTHPSVACILVLIGVVVRRVREARARWA